MESVTCVSMSQDTVGSCNIEILGKLQAHGGQLQLARVQMVSQATEIIRKSFFFCDHGIRCGLLRESWWQSQEQDADACRHKLSIARPNNTWRANLEVWFRCFEVLSGTTMHGVGRKCLERLHASGSSRLSLPHHFRQEATRAEPTAFEDCWAFRLSTLLSFRLTFPTCMHAREFCDCFHALCLLLVRSDLGPDCHFTVHFLLHATVVLIILIFHA